MATRAKPSPAALAFDEQLNELALPADDPELSDQVKLGKRGALLALADAVWRGHIGPLLTPEDAKLLLRVRTEKDVDDMRRRRRLFAVSDDTQWRYPAFQFMSNGRPIERLPDIVRLFDGLQVSPYTLASWFVTPQAEIEGQTPVEWLRDGKPAAPVLAIAAETAARLRQ